MGRRFVALILLMMLSACGSGGSSSPSLMAVAPITSAGGTVVLSLDPAFQGPPRARFEALIRGATSRALITLAPGAPVPPLAPGSLVIAVGDTVATRALIPATETASLASEGFILRSSTSAGVTTLATDGRPLDPDPFHVGGNAGLRFGAWAALEELGFAFLHPLAPTSPRELADPTSAVDRREEPRWPVRGIHLHTMHPLELTELLNGWGKKGPADRAGFDAMLDEWERALEWLVANGQNRVEWFLLAADSWRAFASSPERQARLAELVRRAHAWGLAAGVDAPLALKQQHAFVMIESPGNAPSELAQIRARLAWLWGAGLDFVGTDMGTSEFTPTDDVRTLAWLNELARDARAAGKRAYAKIHCSTGQVARTLKDPVTGGPLNFNFLARLADPSLGIYPHTVQHYGLDDPAPTYGNVDFGYMRTFLQEEAGARETIWHPESAYWVSFDVDVPLFLPVYAERRVHDLRLIAADERAGKVGRGAHKGARMDGQMVFSSGWEWGYWLNDVVAARAAWNPRESAATDEDALRAILDDALKSVGTSRGAAREAIVALARSERELLIEGRVNGARPRDIERRNGQAYLQGWETWDDVSVDLHQIGKAVGAHLEPTQPEKLGLVEMRSPFSQGPDYPSEVEPLLAEMERTLADRADAFDRLRGAPLLDELADASRVTALRARQVHGLYDWVHARARPRLNGARDALDAAQSIVLRRERSYRCDADRIAGWRPNPTAYEYGYLWTARSLHYWWRDEEKAVDAPASPFVMNVISPLDVVLGEGAWLPLADAARAWGQAHGLGAVTAGLAPPPTEPRYPANGLRSRP